MITSSPSPDDQLDQQGVVSGSSSPARAHKIREGEQRFLFNANIAANGLVGNAELAMIIADLHIAAGNVLEALPLVASAVETWFATYENEEEYPHYLDDPMWIVGTVSMAVSLARRAGEADLASSWFWKAKSFSGMFQWQYPTQSPGNLNWFPQPPMEGNIEVPGW